MNIFIHAFCLFIPHSSFLIHHFVSFTIPHPFQSPVVTSAALRAFAKGTAPGGSSLRVFR